MINLEKRRKIESELAMAQQARTDGMEGKARVCARRAVGIALRGYYSQRQPQTANSNVVDLIQAFGERPGLPQNLRVICSHLVTRVDPDYQLPTSMDLLSDAKILIDAILLEEDNA
ncbi:MAG TPA: hypothetical protein VN452_02405 [Longilinea sp.]|nr:hypothetical protein [Longilinea sp.]